MVKDRSVCLTPRGLHAEPAVPQDCRLRRDWRNGHGQFLDVCARAEAPAMRCVPSPPGRASSLTGRVKASSRRRQRANETALRPRYLARRLREGTRMTGTVEVCPAMHCSALASSLPPWQGSLLRSAFPMLLSTWPSPFLGRKDEAAQEVCRPQGPVGLHRTEARGRRGRLARLQPHQRGEPAHRPDPSIH